MGDIVTVILFTLGSCGHVALWTILFNRLHTMPWPRPLLKVLERTIEAVVLVGLASIVAWYVLADRYDSPLVLIYAGICWLVMLRTIVLWWDVEAKRRNPTQLVNLETCRVDVAEEQNDPLVQGTAASWLSRIPFNQIHQLSLDYETIAVPGLPAKLAGLRIAHLSDLHFTGRQTKAFFESVAQHTNTFDPHMTVVTGDIVDKTHCLDWIPDTLGKLTAQYGCYYILGNHDKRVDVSDLRTRLDAAGLIYVGREPSLAKIHEDCAVQLYGTEMPWFGPPVEPEAVATGVFPILLSHSPDQLPWARQHEFPLMLAGHTHGGQIAPPFIGPIISPSCYGTRYASGLFYEPPTVLHVTRGVAGVHPIRINCPPEIGLLTLEPA